MTDKATLGTVPYGSEGGGGALVGVAAAFSVFGLGQLAISLQNMNAGRPWMHESSNVTSRLFGAGGDRGVLSQALIEVAINTHGGSAIREFLILVALGALAISAYAMASRVGGRAVGAAAILVTLFLAAGCVEWRLLAESWATLLAGAFHTTGWSLLADVLDAGKVRPHRAWVSVLAGVLFGLGVLTSHVSWLVLVPTVCWFLWDMLNRANPKHARLVVQRSWVLGAASTVSLAWIAAAALGQGSAYKTWLFNSDQTWSPTRNGKFFEIVSGHPLIWLTAVIVVAPSAAAWLSREDRSDAWLLETGGAKWNAETTAAVGVLCLLPSSPLPFVSLQHGLLLGAPWIACCAMMQCIRISTPESHGSRTAGGKAMTSRYWVALMVVLGIVLVARLAAVGRIEHMSLIERASRAFE